MDDAFADQTSRLTLAQRHAVREWQKTDRFYEQVQALARGTLNVDALPPEKYDMLRRQLDRLDAAIRGGLTTSTTTVYRGIRSLRRTFGVASADELPEEPEPFRGYTAASVFRDIAVNEFTGSDGALLEIEVPAGTTALWVAGAGDPKLRRQGEVLFDTDLMVRVTGVRQDRDLLVVSMQVVNS